MIEILGFCISIHFGMGVPVTWFIDESGAVVHKKIGVLTNEAELHDLTLQYLHVAIG